MTPIKLSNLARNSLRAERLLRISRRYLLRTQHYILRPIYSRSAESTILSNATRTSKRDEISKRTRQEVPPGTAIREPRIRIQRYDKRRSPQIEHAVPNRHNSL